MLVPGCTGHQSVIIDNDIKLTVLYIKLRQVLPGIDAPDSAEFRREALFSQIEETEE